MAEDAAKPMETASTTPTPGQEGTPPQRETPPPTRTESAPAPLPPLAKLPAPAIVTRQLTKRYGSLTALDSLDLVLEKGDVFGFIGPNGAGKSTTMKILAGLLAPTSGHAEVLGKDVSHNGDFVRRNIGYMPDFFNGYEDLTVTEYLEFFAAADRETPRDVLLVIGQDVHREDLALLEGCVALRFLVHADHEQRRNQ